MTELIATELRMVEDAWSGVTLMRSFDQPDRGVMRDILGSYDADAPTFIVRHSDGSTETVENDGGWLVVGHWRENTRHD